MGEASIPVDLLNPGQVFACLGFLEAADIVCGGAEGCFEPAGAGKAHFRLKAGGKGNPFAAVLDFLAAARVVPLVPEGEAPEKISKEDAAAMRATETFPGPEAEAAILPCLLAAPGSVEIPLSQWAEPSERDERKPFKLFAGGQSATQIVRDMLEGSNSKRTHGLKHLWISDRTAVEANPFDVLTPIGPSSKLDARSGWNAIDVGYSPYEQGHVITSSPIVELLAAIGLENARPQQIERSRLRYCVWSTMLPPMLARAAFGAATIGMAGRTFEFKLIPLAQGYKILTFAREENS